jgi:MoaA/NifB/PqqE/SkfB family radical SAM enzyme
MIRELTKHFSPTARSYRRLLMSPRALPWAPFLAQMVLTRRCNLDCGYCNEYDKTSPPVPTEHVKRWIDKLDELRCVIIEYHGGEPLLHPDIVPLVAHAAKKGFFERWIITNGYLLSETMVDKLADAGLTNLQISIDGVTPNATTVKVLKPLRKKLEMLSRRMRFKVQVNAVLGAANGTEALEVTRTVQALGFTPRVCVIHDEHGAMSLDEQDRHAWDEIQRVIGARFKESGDYRHRLLTEGSAPFRCRAGGRYLYIDEFGLVNWCSQQRGVFSKPLLEYTRDDLKEQFNTVKECAPQCTVGCVRSASRFDEWRPQDLQPRLVHRSPARNQEALIPPSSLRPRVTAKPKRSQADWRRARPNP